MQSNMFLTLMVVAVAAMTAAPPAQGDAPCNKGYRDSTPAERATMTAVLETARDALPPAPAGWGIVGDDQISITKGLCRDYEAAPWAYQFNRSYQRMDDQDARDRILADAAVASAAARKLKQPRLDAAMARMNELSQAQVALVQKGDMARATAMNEDIAKAQADYQKIMDEGDDQAQMQAAVAKASRDQSMYINVVVNSNQETTDAGARSFPPPTGARAAFRWSTTRGDVAEDHALILLGQWRSVAEGGWKRVPQPAMAPTAAQVISIRVTADRDRMAATIASINVQALAARVPN